MLQNYKPLPMSEVIVAVSCELYEMGKMVSRIVGIFGNLGLELKEFGWWVFLEKTIRVFSGFSGVDKEKVEWMGMQGNFVIQCAIKWYLITGRSPGPVIVAELAFVGAVNGVDFRLFEDWWRGRSEMCEKLLMEQMLDKDVGLDALPPSCIRGCNAVKRRREKIRAAKARINSIINAPTSMSNNVVLHSRLDSQSCSSNDVGAAVNAFSCKRRKKQRDSFELEDLIIETLLLHQVKEEEIKKGHYNASVFKSGLV